MKNSSFFIKSLLFCFLCMTSNSIFSQTNTPYFKLVNKVKHKSVWYKFKGVDIEKYDWNDAKMNQLLGDFEGASRKRKAFNITGGITLGVGIGLLGLGLVTEKEECGNGLFDVYCQTANELRKGAIILGVLSTPVGTTFLINGKKQRQKEDALFVEILERQKQLGF